MSEKEVEDLEEQLLELQGRIRGVLKRMQKGQEPEQARAGMEKAKELMRTAMAGMSSYREAVYRLPQHRQMALGKDMEDHTRTMETFTRQLQTMAGVPTSPPPQPHPAARNEPPPPIPEDEDDSDDVPDIPDFSDDEEEEQDRPPALPIGAPSSAASLSPSPPAPLPLSSSRHGYSPQPHPAPSAAAPSPPPPTLGHNPSSTSPPLPLPRSQGRAPAVLMGDEEEPIRIATKGLPPLDMAFSCSPAEMEKKAVGCVDDDLVNLADGIRTAVRQPTSILSLKSKLSEFEATLKAFRVDIHNLEDSANRTFFQGRLQEHEEALTQLKAAVYHVAEHPITGPGVGGQEARSEEASPSSNNSPLNNGSTLGYTPDLPLVCGYANVMVNGYAVAVSLTMQFTNVSRSTLPVSFKYDVKKEWTLCDFTVIFPDSTELRYQTHKQDNTTPQAHASEHRRVMFNDYDRLMLDLGTLAPRQVLRVQITYGCRLEEDPENTNCVSLRLPSTVFPPEFNGKAARPEDLRKSSLGVTVISAASLEMIHSKTHPITINEPPADSVYHNRSASIYLDLMNKTDDELAHSHPLLPMRMDFVLQLELKLQKQFLDKDTMIEMDAFAMRETERFAVMIPFVPPVSSASPALLKPNLEAIFVLHWTRTTVTPELRHTLQLCIQSLPYGCMFNVVIYGSEHQSLFASPVPYTTQNVSKAFKWAGKVEPLDDVPACSQSQLYNALISVFDTPIYSHYMRHLYVTVASAITNPLQTTHMVASQHHSTGGRTVINTFVDSAADCSPAAAQVLSMRSQGSHELFENSKELTDLLLKTMRATQLATATEVSLIPGDKDKEKHMTICTQSIPPVPYGTRALLFVMISKELHHDCVKSRGRKTPEDRKFKDGADLWVTWRDFEGAKQKCEIDLYSALSCDGRTLHTLAAQAHIDSLQNMISLDRSAANADDVEKICAASRSYHIMSWFTKGCCAGDRQSSPTSLKIDLPSVTVPPDLIYNAWINDSTPPDNGAMKKFHESSKRKKLLKRHMMNPIFAKTVDKVPLLKRDVRVALLSTRKEGSLSFCDCIIYLQMPEGFWALDKDICGLLDTDQTAIRRSMPECAKKGDIDAWVTAIVVVYLHNFRKAEQPRWCNVYTKALRWLIGQSKGGFIQPAQAELMRWYERESASGSSGHITHTTTA